MATYARGLTSQAVNLTHTTHWSECLMYYVANACSNRNLCNWRGYLVFSAEIDDRGVDFVVRNDVGRHFDVQVKTVTHRHYTYIIESKFSESLWICLVSLDRRRLPNSLFVLGSRLEFGYE